MKNSNHFIGLETKAEMDSVFAQIVEEIMGDLSTTVIMKNYQIIQALVDKTHAWNAKKDSSPQGAPKEISQEHCTTEKWSLEEIMRNEG